MTPFEKLLQFLITSWRLDLALLGKGAVLLLLLLYLVFSLVVVRQVQLMNKTISGLMSWPLIIMARALVVLSIVIIILAAIIL